MNNQEVYDKVKAHLLSQNRKSLDDDGQCVYRGENGAMCAVGVLIPDDMYLPSMEGDACSADDMLLVLKQLGIDYRLARSLQNVHDNVYHSNWPTALERLAIGYGLKP